VKKMPLNPEVRNKIYRYSSILKFANQIAMVLIPLGLIVLWLFADKLPPNLMNHQFGVADYKFGPLTKLLGILVSLIPSTVTFLLFFNTSKLFALYQKGEILLEKNVRCFKSIGFLFIIKTITDFLVIPLYAIILTMYNGPGNCRLSLSLNSEHLTSLASGIFLMIVAWVIDEARKANEELELTI